MPLAFGEVDCALCCSAFVSTVETRDLLFEELSNIPLEHTPDPQPTVYEGIPFIWGFRDSWGMLRYAPRVCWGFLRTLHYFFAPQDSRNMKPGKFGTDRKRLGGGNSNILYVHPENWGRFPIWLIFFRWVETTNQKRNLNFPCVHFVYFHARCGCCTVPGTVFPLKKKLTNCKGSFGLKPWNCHFTGTVDGWNSCISWYCR